MNYQTMADIFRGLAQTGAWGCFDEFNRIPIEVLSVVATQVRERSILVNCRKPFFLIPLGSRRWRRKKRTPPKRVF
jgi:hypothetical protein